jgi:hypothetical protein
MAWFNFAIAAYDQGRGHVIIEAGTYEEALAKMVAGKEHYDCPLENDGEYEGHRIVDCIKLDAEDQDVKTGECVAEDAVIPGEDQYFNAYDDFRKEAFELIGSAPKERQAEILALLKFPPGLIAAVEAFSAAYSKHGLYSLYAGTEEAAAVTKAADVLDDLLDARK